MGIPFAWPHFGAFDNLGSIGHGKRATWKPHEKHGELTKRSDLPDSVYAFPKKRKEATHRREARPQRLARFDQVEGVTAEERDQAFANIKKAAKHYGIDVTAKSKRDLAKSK